MDREPSLRPILRRLDADLTAAFEGRQGVVLAFSGGLASLVLAALARKRGPVTCVVVGTAGAADVQAALVAKSFLDYRVKILLPSRSSIQRAILTVRTADPRLRVDDVLPLVPVALVRERYPQDLVLSGFGLVQRSSAVARHLYLSRMEAPGMRGPPAVALPRSSLLRLASALAIPDAFARAPRRTPLEGSGIGPVLRAMAHAHHSSVGRLIRELI